MSVVRTLSAHRRRLMPFMLATRIISLTSSTSLALVMNVHHAYANDALPGVTIEERFTAADLLAETNAARLDAGVAPLTLNDELASAAAAKAIDMKERGYWAHFRPDDNKAPWDFIRESGYDYTIAGENLARGFSSVQGITSAWLKSPAHRANLLSSKYTEVGFADIETTDETGKTVLLTVQMFGAR